MKKEISENKKGIPVYVFETINKQTAHMHTVYTTVMQSVVYLSQNVHEIFDYRIEKRNKGKLWRNELLVEENQTIDGWMICGVGGEGMRNGESFIKNAIETCTQFVVFVKQQKIKSTRLHLIQTHRDTLI